MAENDESSPTAETTTGTPLRSLADLNQKVKAIDNLLDQFRLASTRAEDGVADMRETTKNKGTGNVTQDEFKGKVLDDYPLIGEA